MKIGITYDLRSEYLAQGYTLEETAEFDKEDTIEAIDKALQQLGYDTERIGNAKTLTQKLCDGSRWDMVFNICEGMYGYGRSALVPALLEAYRIPYTFSDTLTQAICLHKGAAKKMLGYNVPTPAFAVIENENDIEKVTLRFPLFAKPVAEGTGKGINAASKIENKEQLRDVCSDLLHRFEQPVIVEEFLPGREFTTGIIGTGEAATALGTMEIVLNSGDKEVYSYNNKEHYEKHVAYITADKTATDACAKTALAAWKALGCRDAGRVDLRMDKNGQVNFMEVNPLAGLHPKHSDLIILCRQLGISYAGLIKKIMDSALTRTGIVSKRRKHEMPSAA